MTVRNIYLLFFFLLLQFKTSGQVILSNQTSSFKIGQHLQVLDDPKVVDVTSALASSHFVQCKQDIPNLGLKSGPVWFKFSVKNNSEYGHYLLDIAYPILDKVELYTLDSNQNIIGSSIMGEQLNFKPREYDFSDFIFDINIPPGAKGNFLLKVQSAEQIILPITISRPDRLWEKLSRESTLAGIFLGIVLIMAFYNLFLFFSVKDKGYLYYVVYVVFVGLTQLGIKGYTYQFLWPSSPVFQERSLIIFGCISCLAALLFAEYFLKVKQTAPKGKYIIYGLYLMFVFSLICSIFGNIQFSFQMMLMSTTIGSILIILLSFYVMVKGYAPAKFFFAAWFVLLMGSIGFLLKDYGILPYNIFTSNLVQVASAIEMALLSFGLANSINILKKEKEASQLAALNAARENERIIKEQNIVLEEKVAERTVELKETNDDLNDTLENLKQAQSQLVEAEKMASLGQLTAGIAHEINNPINFVTSNITPLKRDVGMVFDTIEFIEQLNNEDLGKEEKQKKINQFKEDLDYDYLKEEINHLLKGIHEGSSRTAEIVKGLRIFSRVDENDLKRADMNEGIDSTLIIVNNLLNSTISIVKDYTEPLPLIECYAGKLNQVFLNILSNSIHAIRKQHGEKSAAGVISIATKAFDDYITVEFSDNGTGMDEQTMHKIYEPFFTTKDVGEGTGLGMSIVYNTIKKHNGIITLKSELGVGSTFIIRLPIIHELPEIN